MSRIRAYFWTWPESGSFAFGDYVEISDDIVGTFSDIKMQLDQNQYDLGVFKVSELTIKLRNDHGKYLEATDPLSVFVQKRRDTVCEIYWAPNDHDLICGFTECGHPDAVLGTVDPVTKEGLIYSGLLEDVGSSTDVDDQTIQFKILGFETLLSRIQANYSTVSTSDNLNVNIYTLLNQAPLTNYLTISQANITTALNYTLDSKAKMENNTVLNVLKDLLFIGNAVLRVDPVNYTIYVSPRDETASLIQTFYGQSSTDGLEDIFDINRFTDGLNRTLNFWKWKDTTVVSVNSTSTSNYGTLFKEISSDYVTNSTKQQNILDSFKSEFADPKKEFEFKTPMNVTNNEITLLDKLTFSMPSQMVNADNANTPFYNVAVYDVDSYPVELNMVVLDTTMFFKVLAKQYLLKEDMIKFYVREI